MKFALFFGIRPKTAKSLRMAVFAASWRTSADGDANS